MSGGVETNTGLTEFLDGFQAQLQLINNGHMVEFNDSESLTSMYGSDPNLAYLRYVRSICTYILGLDGSPHSERAQAAKEIHRAISTQYPETNPFSGDNPSR